MAGQETFWQPPPSVVSHMSPLGEDNTGLGDEPGCKGGGDNHLDQAPRYAHLHTVFRLE